MKSDQVDYRYRVYASYRTSQTGTGWTEKEDDRANRGPYLRNLIRSQFPANRDAKILDLGCGSGTLLHYLQEAGYRNAEGVDAAAEQVELAQRLGIRGVRQGDSFEALRSSDAASLDVVVTFDVIEHMTKPELLELADEIHRTLKAGGKWVIHAPNADSPFGAGIRYRDWTHEQAFTQASMTQFLKVVGFRQVRCYEDAPVVHGLKSGLRMILWKGVRAALRVYWVAETGSSGRSNIFSQNLLAVGVK